MNGINNCKGKTAYPIDCRQLCNLSFCTKSWLHKVGVSSSKHDLCTSAYGSKYYQGVKSKISKTVGTQNYKSRETGKRIKNFSTWCNLMLSDA